MNRTTTLVLVIALAAFGAAGCKKRSAPVAPPPPSVDNTPKITPKVDAPPPPLSASQRVAIEGDFEKARKIASEARDLRLKGEGLEREKGREHANDTYVAARKKYREAAALTERWVEPELGQVSQKQLDRDPEVKRYFEERGSWIQEDASMGQKLNAR